MVAAAKTRLTLRASRTAHRGTANLGRKALVSIKTSSLGPRPARGVGPCAVVLPLGGGLYDGHVFGVLFFIEPITWPQILSDKQLDASNLNFLQNICHYFRLTVAWMGKAILQLDATGKGGTP